ncbi:hypothetical protein N9U71_04860 [Candidatus Pelagibacter sp.]|nr:hypothetical protein [Candidatus Pelagibacter sp.]|tara:strand:+ start:139 stop:597 length:459 start_codon:yes stop_codon:yes gene_type:complete
MLKRIFFIIILFNFLSHCDYKPVYSDQNKVNYKIIITSFSGDKDINNSIAASLKRSSKNNSDEIINISFDTKYTKSVLAKNTAGNITDYQTNVVTTFEIQKRNNLENFEVKEKFNFQKMTDKYEEKNYEQNIKRNLASSISQKLILRLAVIK